MGRAIKNSVPSTPRCGCLCAAVLIPTRVLHTTGQGSRLIAPPLFLEFTVQVALGIVLLLTKKFCLPQFCRTTPDWKRHFAPLLLI